MKIKLKNYITVSGDKEHDYNILWYFGDLYLCTLHKLTEYNWCIEHIYGGFEMEIFLENGKKIKRKKYRSFEETEKNAIKIILKLLPEGLFE